VRRELRRVGGRRREERVVSMRDCVSEGEERTVERVEVRVEV